MVALAIGSIVLLLVGTLVASSGDSYGRVGGSVHAGREARALITRLHADLATAVFHPDTLIEAGTGDWPGDRIGFLTLQPAAAQSDNTRIGDLCAAHYFLKDLTIGGKTVRCLMRGFRDSAPAFDALREGRVASLFTPRDAIDEPIAFGVVSFTARPISTGPGGEAVDWVRGESPPDFIDVRLVIARRDLAGRLRTSADWDGTGGLTGDPAMASHNRNLEIFQSRIRFGP
jgi:hypothetical protein